MAVCAGCQNRLPGAPVPLSIDPPQADADQVVDVTITGQAFWPQVVTDFKSDSQSHLDTAFLVDLGGVSLQNVVLQSDLTLTATTPPLQAGLYDLTVVGPNGQSGTLKGAFAVIPVTGCDGGSCQMTCAETLCGAECVDLATDSSHCGSCTISCAAGQQCDGGQCACPAATPDPCTGDAGAFCTDTQTDPGHCGSCTNACGPGLACCAGGCVDTVTDPGNCGSCGNACPAGGYCGGDAGCLSLPAQCATAIPLDGDRRWIGADGGGCVPASSGFIDDDAGKPVDCTGDGVCLQDTSLDGGWYRFTGVHSQLFNNDAGTLTKPFHCGTEEPGWLATPIGPTPIGVPTAGSVCFVDDVGSCDYTSLIQVLNCGDAGYVYQLSNFTGVCVTSPYIVNLGAYCTQ